MGHSNAKADNRPFCSALILVSKTQEVTIWLHSRISITCLASDGHMCGRSIGSLPFMPVHPALGCKSHLV